MKHIFFATSAYISSCLNRIAAPCRYLLVAVTILFLTSEGVLAGIRISPARIETTVTPENHTFPLTIENSGSNPLRVEVSAVQLTQKLDGSPLFDESKEGYEYGDRLVKFSLTDFIMMPNTKQTVIADVQIPAYSSRGAYAAVFFTASSVMGEVQHVSSVIRVTTIMLLKFGEQSQPQGELTNVELIQSEPGQPIRILSTFLNQGDVHIAPRGTVMISDAAGQEHSRVPIQSANTLPGYSRQ
ncbi:MAG: hypothetical protein O7D34_00020, partial [Ignavibacteria bacterium]|nr:hypothetical protein [Ignavibacteria bacterium]